MLFLNRPNFWRLVALPIKKLLTWSILGRISQKCYSSTVVMELPDDCLRVPRTIIYKIWQREFKNIFFSFAVSPEIWKTTEELQTCSPIKSISFAKTHKTGSSTVQNIFLRYGWENNLTFVLPEKRTWMFGFKTQFRSGSSGYISGVLAWLSKLERF